MRYKVLLGLSLALLSNPLFAQWKKINDLDYTWGPFKIYNISLFTENGEYTPESRPLMLTLNPLMAVILPSQSPARGQILVFL